MNRWYSRFTAANLQNTRSSSCEGSTFTTFTAVSAASPEVDSDGDLVMPRKRHANAEDDEAPLAFVILHAGVTPLEKVGLQVSNCVCVCTRLSLG